MAKGKTEQYPTYEEGVTYREKTNLYAERFCSCGAILRLRAPIEDILKFIANWNAGHVDVAGHEPVDKVTCIKAREELKRNAISQAIGNPNVDNKELANQGLVELIAEGDDDFDPNGPEEQFRYVPTDWDKKNVGVTNEEVYA